jgi:hypothetical protein
MLKFLLITMPLCFIMGLLLVVWGFWWLLTGCWRSEYPGVTKDGCVLRGPLLH